jgi:hypothetical protein
MVIFGGRSEAKNQKVIDGMPRSVAENRQPQASYGKIEEGVSREYVSRGVEATPGICQYTSDSASPALRRYMFQRDTLPLCR